MGEGGGGEGGVSGSRAVGDDAGGGGGGGVAGGVRIASVGADAVGRARGAAAVAGTALSHPEAEVCLLGARMTRVLLASPAGRKQAVGSAKLSRAMGEAAKAKAKAKAKAAEAAGIAAGSRLDDLPRQLDMMMREMDTYRRRSEARGQTA